MWRRLRAVLPERRGVLILDGTSFPKQGTASVGVARQYCGALGKIANCQVAVTAALWTGVRAWCLGAAAVSAGRVARRRSARQRARIPAAVRFQEKWRLALPPAASGARARGLTVTAVLADAEFGDVTAFRRGAASAAAAVCRRHLVASDGASRRARVSCAPSHRRGRPRTRWRMVRPSRRWPCARWPRSVPRSRVATASRGATARSRTRRGPLRGRPRHAGARVARTADSRPRSGCCAKRRPAHTPRSKYYFVHLPATASLRALGAPRASTLGHRAAVSRAQERTGARSLRRAHVARVAPSRGADGRRARLHPARAHAPRRGQR